MNTSYRPKTMTDMYNHRSYFDWGSNMQVVRKGKGEIAMTESELVRFFGVTWKKLNHRLQTTMKSSNLHPDERSAGQKEVIKKGETVGYSPLYPFLLSSPCPFCWTAWKRICSESTSVEDCRQRLPLYRQSSCWAIPRTDEYISFFFHRLYLTTLLQ